MSSRMDRFGRTVSLKGCVRSHHQGNLKAEIQQLQESENTLIQRLAGLREKKLDFEVSTALSIYTVWYSL